MSVVIHARVCLCFAVSFCHFEFCILSQSGQRSETIKEPGLGVLSRENCGRNGRKMEDTNYETEALDNPVCARTCVCH